MQNFKKAIACLFILVGATGLPTAVLSLLKPFGAKLYDTGDPLGSPVTIGQGGFVICLYVLMLVVGIWLTLSLRRNRGNIQKIPGEDWKRAAKGPGNV